MPLVGIFDVALAGSMGVALFCPWAEFACILAIAWGFGTALMRPLSNESILGLVERFGNFLTPAALLFIITHPGTKWFK